jgi:6-pyruvoyltetrahydropterin/6-carboxytetrahydropterin synthase
MKLYKQKVRMHFDAAHKLTDYIGKCSNLHGHRWDVVVEFCGTSLNEGGILIDFSWVKDNIGELLPDHDYLNDVYGEKNPTAEFIAAKLFDIIKKGMEGYKEVMSGGLWLGSVEVFESPECSIRVEEIPA